MVKQNFLTAGTQIWKELTFLPWRLWNFPMCYMHISRGQTLKTFFFWYLLMRMFEMTSKFLGCERRLKKCLGFYKKCFGQDLDVWNDFECWFSLEKRQVVTILPTIEKSNSVDAIFSLCLRVKKVKLLI